MVFVAFDRRCDCAVFTFGVVVEEAVVSAGLRVSFPERGSTEAERRELDVSLRESLLQLSLQSLDEPPKERTHTHTTTHTCKTPEHLKERFMACFICWVADKVQKSLRQDGNEKVSSRRLRLPCIDFLFLLLPPLQLCGPLLLLLLLLPQSLQLPSELQPPSFFSQLHIPLHPPLLLQTKPLLVCFDASGKKKNTKLPYDRRPGYIITVRFMNLKLTTGRNNEQNDVVTLLPFFCASCASGGLSLASSQRSCTDGGASGDETDAAETQTHVRRLRGRLRFDNGAGSLPVFSVLPQGQSQAKGPVESSRKTDNCHHTPVWNVLWNSAACARVAETERAFQGQIRKPELTNGA